MAVEIHTNGGGSGGGSGGSAFIGFLCGAALLAVAVIGFFMWDNYKSGGAGPQAPTAVIKVEKK